MAKGEARYSSAGKPVVRFDNKPLPKDDYQLELKKEGLEIKRSVEKGPDAIPYINCRFAALGTATKEGGKDRLVFNKFFLSLKPGSDGIVMPERGGGLVEFCRSYGEEADFGLITQEQSDGTEVTFFDPEEVLEYLEGKVGDARSCHVGIDIAKDKSGTPVKNHPGNNKINHWNLDGSVMTGEEEVEEKKPAKNVTPLKKAGGKK
jgi:hypothetical protein